MNSAEKIAAICLFLGVLLIFPLQADNLRSFDELFPGLTVSQKRRVFNGDGFKRTFLKTESPFMVPARNSGINLLGKIMEKKPSHIIEALLVVPHNGRTLNKLDAYNAIGKIGNIKNYLFFHTRRNMEMPIFEETTRLESDRRRNPIPDPPPARTLPASETMYVRIKDTFFGNLFIRGEFSSGRYGITYDMTNFLAVRYLIFTIMRAEKFSAVIYMEPIEEGMLVYGMSCIDVPDFLVSKLNISTDIERRLSVFIRWIRDGLYEADNG